MKATLFSANQKAQKTIEMEKLVGLIRDGYKEKQVAALREELRYTIPGVSVKEANRLPVVYFCSTIKKQDGTFVRDQYNGLVLLKINNLANCNEAKKYPPESSRIITDNGSIYRIKRKERENYHSFYAIGSYCPTGRYAYSFFPCPGL